MSKSFGLPTTSQFMIGNFEFRVGGLNSAGSLTRSHSVGIVDGFTLNSQINKVDLMASTPRRVVDTAITSMLSSISVNLREYSARNLRMLLSEGVNDYSGPETRFNATGVVSGSTTGSVTLQLATSSLASTPVTDLTYYVGTSGTLLTWAADATLPLTTTSGGPTVTTYEVKGDTDTTLGLTFAAQADATYIVSFKIKTSTAGNLAAIAGVNSSDTVKVVSGGGIPRVKNISIPATDAKTLYKEIKFSYTPGTSQGNVKLVFSKGYVGKLLNDFKVTKLGQSLVKGDTVTVILDDDIVSPVVTTVTADMSADTVIVNNMFTGSVANNSPIRIYRNETIGAGNMDSSKRFFTASLVQLDRSGSIPIVYDFWKCALSSGLDMSIDTTQFAQTQLQIKVLKPMQADVMGGSLSHLYEEIEKAPTWRYSSLPVRTA